MTDSDKPTAINYLKEGIGIKTAKDLFHFLWLAIVIFSAFIAIASIYLIVKLFCFLADLAESIFKRFFSFFMHLGIILQKMFF